MPSSNGVYSLPVGYLAVTGQTIQASQHNPPLEDIAAALTNRLSRDGTAPMIGPIQATAGSAIVPSYTFQDANSTGFYKTANGVGISVNGTLIAEITSGGVPIADQAVTYQKIQAPSAVARLLGSNNNPALAITAAASAAGLIRLVVASTATFTTGQKKIVSNVGGTTEANGRWTITVVDSTHIDLQGSAFVNAYTSGGTIGGGVDELKLGNGLSLAGDTLASTIDATLLPGSVSGLTLSTAGSTGTFGVAAGVANDGAQGGLMKLASAYTKTTASWAVGSGNGALDTGAIANSTWYHVYLIERVDTAVVDVLLSLSASTPTLPTNYTLSRRIGAMKTDGSSHWTLFHQLGDDFLWDTNVIDINAATSLNGNALIALTVPTGINVEAKFVTEFTSGGGGNHRVLFTSPDVAAQTPIAGTTSLFCANSTTAAEQLSVRTNTSAQIRNNGSSTNCTYTVGTYGWVDRRGKL